VTKTNALETLVIASFVRGLPVRDVEAALAEALGDQAAISKSTVSAICGQIKELLSEVPPASAGAGSGVLTTTQQTALALGVATLGSLFLSLVGGGRAISTAFIVVIAIQTVVAIGIAAGARGLPGWRTLAQAPQVAAE